MYSKILILIVFSTATILFASCDRKTANGPTPVDAKHYKLSGEIVSFDKRKRSVSIKHDEIEGYMDAMTMDFPIKEDWVFDDLTPGAEINADLVVANSEEPPFWLENISITSARDPDSKAPPIKNEVAAEGMQILDFSLTNQDGKPVSPKDFIGMTWAVTFVYSECPLPNFCIAMSRNFSDLANQIAADKFLREKIRLLTISFDPKRDTPAKLRKYGLGYLGKNSADSEFRVWQLAVGNDDEIRKIADFFGLRFEKDEKDTTQFNHSLRTAVISPSGKIRKVYSGADWTPNELLNKLKETAQ